MSKLHFRENFSNETLGQKIFFKTNKRELCIFPTLSCSPWFLQKFAQLIFAKILESRFPSLHK
jgi:hypothetical protein